MSRSSKLDLKTLRSFLTAARHLSFTRAAAELGLTQPGISIHVRKLEEALGADLILHVGNRVTLTDAGRTLMEAGGHLMAAVERIEDEIAAIAGSSKGRLRIGASTTPGIYLLPTVLRGFVEDHPGVEVRCTIGATREIESRLVDQELDCALIGAKPSSTLLESEPFVEDRLVMVAARGHPLAGRKALSRRDLQSEPYIMREGGSATRQRLEAWLQRRRVVPRVLMELSSPEAVKRMVAARLGISGVSAFAVDADPELEGLCVLPELVPPLRRRLRIAYPARTRRSPAVEAFVAHARRIAGALQASVGGGRSPGPGSSSTGTGP